MAANDLVNAVASPKQVDKAPERLRWRRFTPSKVIEEVLAKYGTPDIFNTDQGSQFTADEFSCVVVDADCKLSMDRRGAWRDNVFVERL